MQPKPRPQQRPRKPQPEQGKAPAIAPEPSVQIPTEAAPSQPEQKKRRKTKKSKKDKKRKTERATDEPALSTDQPRPAKSKKPTAPQQQQPVRTEMARPRTVYPAGYTGPHIDPDPVELTHFLSNPYAFEHRHPVKGYNERVYYEQPVAQHSLPPKYRAARPGMFFLDTHVAPTNVAPESQQNEVAGSELMEKNQKARELELSRSKREHELKAEYDRSLEEMTADYRAKLRDLDINYNDRKRELDAERAKLQQEVQTAEQNMQNPNFGVRAEDTRSPDLDPYAKPSSPLFDDLDIGVNQGSSLHRLEPLHIIEPFEVEDIEEAPVLAQEIEKAMGNRSTQDGLPGMIEMDAQLINPDLRRPKQDPLLHGALPTKGHPHYADPMPHNYDPFKQEYEVPVTPSTTRAVPINFDW